MVERPSQGLVAAAAVVTERQVSSIGRLAHPAAVARRTPSMMLIYFTAANCLRATGK